MSVTAPTTFGAYSSFSVTGPDEDGVVVVTLNAPERLNAFDQEMADELNDILIRLRNPQGIGAVVITGTGDAFSAGGDIETIRSFARTPVAEIGAFQDAMHMVIDYLSIRPPVICVVNGHAAGLGATVALLADIIYMAEDAHIADTHVCAGIVAGDGGSFIWPSLIGPNRAKQYLLTGDPLDAETALALGMVNFVGPKEAMLEEALRLARRLSRGPRHAIAWTKQSINLPMLRNAMLVMPFSTSQEACTIHQPDMLEGTTAFLEKRRPTWPSTT